MLSSTCTHGRSRPRGRFTYLEMHELLQSLGQQYHVPFLPGSFTDAVWHKDEAMKTSRGQSAGRRSLSNSEEQNESAMRIDCRRPGPKAQSAGKIRAGNAEAFQFCTHCVQHQY